MVSIFLPLLITINLFILSKTEVQFQDLTLSWTLISQLFSLLGTVLLSLSFVLGSRASFLDNIFGGLDKVIKIHHIIGGISFVLLIHHPLFLALGALPNYNLASHFLFFSQDITYNFGVVALYGMILLLTLTLLIKLPYDLWLKTHDIFGIVLLFASLHIFFITSDVSRYLPLRIWMMVNLAIGNLFYIYKIFLYKWFGPKYRYIVERINEIGDVLEIYVTPENKSIKFMAGQFAFINFDKPGLSEAHPFSFASSPNSSTIRFCVKILGDYTLKLRQLTPGTRCEIWGSYGKFYYRFGSKKDVVCIAGGIGITPFISLLNYELDNPSLRKIFLMYSAKSENNAIYHSDLITMAGKLPNFSYFPNFDDFKPRITCQTVMEVAGELSNKVFYLCGPVPMMYSISAQLKEKGVKSSDIIFEDFNFK